MPHFIKRASLALLASLTLAAGLFSCQNNVFNPSADLRIVNVSSSGTVIGGTVSVPIGITQRFATANGLTTVNYSFAEPVVIFENRPMMPRVNFTKLVASYTLSGGLTVPTREFIINISSQAPVLAAGISQGSPVAVPERIELKILSTNSDLLATVYPADSFNRVTEGKADIVLIGKDDNGYTKTIELSVPLIFSSTGGTPPTPQPSLPPASVTPTPAAGSPSPSPSPSRGS